MNTSKRLLSAFFALVMLVASQGITAAASVERERVEALLYVQYNKLIVEDFTALAIAKEDTKIYNGKGNEVAVLKKDAAADIIGLNHDQARYEVISGTVKGFVDADKLLTGKMAELRAVIILDEKAEAESKVLDYKTKEVVVDNSRGTMALEILMEGVLEKAEPIMIEVEEHEDVILGNGDVQEEEQISARKIKYTQADLDLLAAIVYCESGNQSYEGKLAVANVILNRVEDSRFPNDIKGVVYAPRQFSPARNGRLKKTLQNKAPQACYDAAEAALNGENNVEGYLYFDGKRHQGGYKKIGAHYFWKTPW